MPNQIFDAASVAAYLHMEPPQINLLVKRGEIPYESRGSRVVFRRSEIDAWASQRILGLPSNRLTAYHATSSAKMHNLSKHHALMPELTRPVFISVELTSRTKPSLIRDMKTLADKTGLVSNPDDLLTSLQEREALCSTAISDGIALLHPRHHEPYMFDDSFVVLGRTIQPLPFGAADGQKTDLFFLICCQDDRIHLHVLARVCMMCRQTKLIATLRQAESADAMHNALLAAEQEIIKPQPATRI